MIRLLITIVLLALVAVWAKRADRRSSGRGGITVTARASIARSCGTAVVEVDGRRFLIGWGPQGPSPIAELGPAPTDPAGTVSEAETPLAAVPAPSGPSSPGRRSLLDRVRQATTITPGGAAR